MNIHIHMHIHIIFICTCTYTHIYTHTHTPATCHRPPATCTCIWWAEVYAARLKYAAKVTFEGVHGLDYTGALEHTNKIHVGRAFPIVFYDMLKYLP